MFCYKWESELILEKIISTLYEYMNRKKIKYMFLRKSY